MCTGRPDTLARRLHAADHRCQEAIHKSCITCPVPNPNNLGCIKITLAHDNVVTGFVDFIPKYLTSANKSLIVYELDQGYKKTSGPV